MKTDVIFASAGASYIYSYFIRERNQIQWQEADGRRKQPINLRNGKKLEPLATSATAISLRVAQSQCAISSPLHEQGDISRTSRTRLYGAILSNWIGGRLSGLFPATNRKHNEREASIILHVAGRRRASSFTGNKLGVEKNTSRCLPGNVWTCSACMRIRNGNGLESISQVTGYHNKFDFYKGFRISFLLLYPRASPEEGWGRGLVAKRPKCEQFSSLPINKFHIA